MLFVIRWITFCENSDLISPFSELSGPNLGARQAYQLTNTFFNNGFFIKIPNGLNGNLRIEIDHILPNSEEASFQRNFIILEDFAELTIVETFRVINRIKGITI